MSIRAAFARRSAAALVALLVHGASLGGDGHVLGDDDAIDCESGKLALFARGAMAFDEATGRDKRNFPRDRVVDYEHMTLRMRFEDIDQPRFEAVQTLRFRPIGRPSESIALDAAGLTIASVTRAGDALEHFQDDDSLTLRFDPPLPVGRPVEIDIEYACEQPADGMTFTPSSPAAPGYTAEVHTQGEAESNHFWFPCHDFPNERLSTELIVDVPAGFSVSSNGRLVSQSATDGRSVWHYLQEKPHVAYLVSLVIGKFDVVELPGHRVPMHVWAPAGRGDLVLQTYGRTGEMIDVFEERFGVPYPWDRYDQLIVKNFEPGGMENTSATTMHPSALLDRTALLDGDLDGLISHELAHQWTGDLITCKSWAHIWLNEGWASYGEALWYEKRDGIDGYLDAVRGDFGVGRRDQTSDELPMVSPVWDNPDEPFSRPANPYPKGAAILHMLRRMLGDDAFFAGVRLYMNRHALGTVETNDFRYAMEEASGLGLEWFFDQWCYRPGTPRLTVDVRYDAATRELSLSVDQTQQIDARTPAFRFELPVFVRTAAGERTWKIDVREKSTSWRAELDGPPEIVAVDPSLDVLKVADVKKPMGLWLAQVSGGPTLVARHEAIEALAGHDDPDTIALLSRIILDDSSRQALRRTAISTLSGFSSDDARDTLMVLATSAASGGVGEARVRARLVEAIRELERDDVVPLLATFAASDESYAVRAEAIEGLAGKKSKEQADLIVGMVAMPSQGERLRGAALRALAAFDDPRGLDLAIQYAAYGNLDRARPTAIETVGKLAGHDKERATALLLALLEDPERRSRSAAAGALAELGDERAIPALEAQVASASSPWAKRSAERRLKELREKLAGTPREDGSPQRRRDRREGP